MKYGSENPIILVKEISEIIKQNMITRIPENCDFNETKLYETCVKRKQTKLPFTKTHPRSNSHLELKHSNVFRSATPATWGGNR